MTIDPISNDRADGTLPIPSLIEQLLEPLRTSGAPMRERVAAWLTAMRVHAALFSAAAVFSDDRPYGRRLILETSDVEVLIMGFLGGRRCPPHDHGRADGMLLVCAGTVEHQFYRPVPGGLEARDITCDAAGSILTAPADHVHAMGNPHEELLVTLHVYWPPIDRMTIYDLDAGRVLEVDSGAGAWLPADPRHLLSSTDLVGAAPTTTLP